jgi:hypothetical protein
MLLTIGHDNAQFVGVPVNGLLLPVHRSQIERGDSCRVVLERLGHGHTIAEDRVHCNGRRGATPWSGMKVHGGAAGPPSKRDPIGPTAERQLIPARCHFRKGVAVVAQRWDNP